MTLAIIVHGGAKSISEDKVTANNAGCQAAAEAGWAVLTRGGCAAEAVEAAIRVLEADQTFNASLGATRWHRGRGGARRGNHGWIFFRLGSDRSSSGCASSNFGGTENYG